MKLIQNTLIITLLLLALTSCNKDETCRQVKYVALNVYFYTDTVNLKTGDTVQVALSFDSIRVRGIDQNGTAMDSLIKKSGKYVQIPLNQFAETSKFFLKCNKNIDTLTIYHTNSNHFLSLECGSIRVHNLTTANCTDNYFYKASVINPEVNISTTNANAQNITLHHFR